MGEIKFAVELENFGDRYLFLKNGIKEEEVRKYRIEAVVDLGSVMLVLPQDVVEKLDLDISQTVIVTYADERKEERSVAGTVTIKIGGRLMNTDCVVGPLMSEALIEQIIMEELDLIPDYQERTLKPRPESPIYPSLQLK